MVMPQSITEQTLRSFAIDIFSPTIIEAGQRAKALTEQIRREWEADTNKDITFGTQHEISMYNCYPYLFLEAFPAIPPKNLQILPWPPISMLTRPL
ncbi:hypothetical protein EPA93_17585 [Ktedonosporobacter rubrisoli]|uniref:Uncharacterized protein n=1 Tax=Ktedonosporobacter rubrisoli TaxID=2509675 RepID=A0A4P6JQT6_KTERU|nr:hypothetical protein [Ktedonosporobacter rubrisoli]QBD77705.1 hypothetical protein EPA93_17585 [Ktedonosporobacter rubrisoli]